MAKRVSTGKRVVAPAQHFVEDALLGAIPELHPDAGGPGTQGTKASIISMPRDIAEESGVSGWLVSHKLRMVTGRKRITVSKSEALSGTRHKLADLAEQIAADGDGAPVVGTNSIKIWIDNEHGNAGSKADYIWMYFGSQKRIKLWGVERTRFPKGWWLQWDLNHVNPSGYLESVPSDAWDEITLVNPFGDGIKIDRIKIVHSGVTILDWGCNTWLDGSKLEAHGRINVTAPMLSYKLGQVDHSWIPQIHWAARELGKTDGTKYDSTDEWCSEFASWCLRKEMWGTPPGNIGSQKMEDYFDSIGRKYTQADLLNGNYKLSPGDYLRFEWSNGKHHSGIFRHYIDDADSPTLTTGLATIEGNTGATVATRTRTIGNVLSVGNTR